MIRPVLGNRINHQKNGRGEIVKTESLVERLSPVLLADIQNPAKSESCLRGYGGVCDEGDSKGWSRG
jgi:hypothetical protein